MSYYFEKCQMIKSSYSFEKLLHFRPLNFHHHCWMAVWVPRVIVPPSQLVFPSFPPPHPHHPLIVPPIGRWGSQFWVQDYKVMRIVIFVQETLTILRVSLIQDKCHHDKIACNRNPPSRWWDKFGDNDDGTMARKLFCLVFAASPFMELGEAGKGGWADKVEIWWRLWWG